MPEMLWNLKVNVKLGGQDISLDLTANEQGLLMMLRSFYPSVEAQFREMVGARHGSLPSGLVDDALALLRCLVYSRLEAHAGKFVAIARAQ